MGNIAKLYRAKIVADSHKHTNRLLFFIMIASLFICLPH